VWLHDKLRNTCLWQNLLAVIRPSSLIIGIDIVLNFLHSVAVSVFIDIGAMASNYLTLAAAVWRSCKCINYYIMLTAVVCVVLQGCTIACCSMLPLRRTRLNTLRAHWPEDTLGPQPNLFWHLRIYHAVTSGLNTTPDVLTFVSYYALKRRSAVKTGTRLGKKPSEMCL
jgi:hypothetical protein